MIRLLTRVGKAVGPAALALAFLTLPASPARAQYMGYGINGGYYGGFGYPGYGGYGYPGYGGFGYGYSGGYGYPGYGGYGGGFGSVGFGGYGYGGYGYSGYGYGGNYGYGAPGIGLYPGIPYGTYNPLFGLGLTPLGVQSALTETAIMRGSGLYGAGARPAGAAPYYYGRGYGVYPRVR